MADYRILFAQFWTAKAASGAARAFSDAYTAHLGAVEKSNDTHAELTEPLMTFARDEGFEWDDDDNFTADGELDLEIGAIGKLLVIYGAAVVQMAEHGLQAFARARGATATMFWDPDPCGTITVRVTKPAGFDEALEAACAERCCELTLTSDVPDTRACLVVKTGKRKRYAPLISSWGLGGVLFDLGKRAGVEVSIEPPAPVVRPRGSQDDEAIAGHASSIIVTLQRAKIDRPTKDECLAEVLRLGVGDDLQALVETRLKMHRDNATVEPLTKAQLRVVAAETELPRTLAAASPMSQREAAMMATLHANWLKTRARPPHSWRRIDFLGTDLVIYLGKTGGMGTFERRDLRNLTLAQRPLVAARFAGALLDGTDFTKADLSHASLSRASLVGAKLTGATLVGADFTGAVLRDASLREADLRDAIWTDADLTGADLTGAKHRVPG